MADIATLGFKVDTRKIKEANAELKKMPSAAASAERSAKGMARGVSGAAQKVANDNAKAAKSVRKLGGAFDIARGQVVAFGIAAAAALASAFAIKNLVGFSDALAEVSTLVNVATFDMEGLETAAIDMSKQFGTSGQEQVKAFYSVISAGAKTAAEATETLTVANKLAVGGVTDIGLAVSGLTAFMNAYRGEVEGATEISDALFVGMKAGQTDVGQLSGSLGKVAPLARSAGASFDELVASVAALTLGGTNTTEAVTGVRAILAGVVKPTKEAADMAALLGLEFNAAALKAKGFQGFIEDVISKTGGATEKLAMLFGGVEALIPIVALAGSAGDDFNDIMGQMADKAGATEAAFLKMSNSPGFQAGRVWSALKAEVLLAGGAFLNSMVPALKAVADNMGTFTKLVKIAGIALLVAFGPAILSSIATGFGFMAAAGVSSITAITAAIAANPFGALAIGLAALTTALWQFRDDINTVFGVDIKKAAEFAANLIVNSFSAAYADVAWVFRNFADIITGGADLDAALQRRSKMIGDIMGRDMFAVPSADGVQDGAGLAIDITGGKGTPGGVDMGGALDKITAAVRKAGLETKILRDELSEVDAKVLRAAESAKLLDDGFNWMPGAHEELRKLTMGLVNLESAQDAANQAAKDAADVVQIISDNATVQEKLNDEIARLNELAPHLTVDQYSTAMERLNKELAEADPLMQKIKSVSDQVGMTIVGAFDSARRSGDSLSRTLKNLALDIAEIAFQMLIAQPTAGALSGGLSGLLGKLFGGGGPVASSGPTPALADTMSSGFGFDGFTGGGGLLGSMSSGFGFDGGGFTGNGARSGGLDGKGGFMAMVHPRETIIDHTKGGGGGDTFNIDARGADRQGMAELKNMIVQINGSIEQRAFAVVSSGNRRGGGSRKALGG